MLIDIDYRYVQAIQFSDRDENFIDVLKQISIYSFIVTSGFLLIQFFDEQISALLLIYLSFQIYLGQNYLTLLI